MPLRTLGSTEKEAKRLFDLFRADPSIDLSTVEEQKFGVPIDFTGMTFVESEDGETVDQSIYIRNKLESVDVKKLRHTDADEELNEADKRIYGTCIGRLIWILPTQIKFSYEIAYLSRYRAYPRVKHLRRVSALIGKIKADPQKVMQN